MRILIGNDRPNLYFLNFADDQVFLAQDKEDARYVLCKLHEEYQKYRFGINCEERNIWPYT